MHEASWAPIQAIGQLNQDWWQVIPTDHFELVK